MKIVKLLNGNVVMTLDNGDIFKLFQQINSVDVVNDDTIIVKDGSNHVTNITASQINSTQVLPASASAFSGDAYQLLTLLANDFFFDISGSAVVTASSVTYDNSISGLTATNVQDAIDEVDADVDTLQSSLKVYVLASASPNTTHTGNTNNTLVYSKLISANVVGAGDCIQISTKFTKPSGSAVNPTVRIYVNTTASLSGATLLATYLTNNLNGRFFLVERTANVDGATTNFISSTSGALTDSATLSVNAPSEISIDWTINQYFIVAIQLGNNADSTTLRMVNVILNKAV